MRTPVSLPTAPALLHSSLPHPKVVRCVYSRTCHTRQRRRLATLALDSKDASQGVSTCVALCLHTAIAITALTSERVLWT